MTIRSVYDCTADLWTISGGAPTFWAVKNPCLTYSQPSIFVIPLYPCSECRDSTNCKLSSTISSVTQSCPTLCDPMDYSMLGFSVRHQLLEPTQTHVHCVSDAIQPSHPLSSPSPSTFNLSQHQGLFKWVSSLHTAAKVLEFRFSISPSNEYSGLISFRIGWLVSLQSRELSRVFSNTTVQKHQFFGAQLSL